MPTLSEIARVKLSPEYIGKKLTQTERGKLRRQAVIDYIKSRPAGERIKLSAFGRVVHLSKENQTWALLKDMLDKKLISRYELAPKRYSYSIVNDPDTVITTPRRLPTAEPDLPKKEVAETEIKITHLFKANDMVADSDLLLRFKIREILEHTNDITTHRKAAILEDECRYLLENSVPQGLAKREGDVDG